MHNGSGMNRAATSIMQAERALGMDSHIANPFEVKDDEWDKFLDADIHVDHTHVPDKFRRKITKPYKTIYVAHGTPEHVFQTSVEAETVKPYGMSDSWMLMQWGLQHSDATVTFWPRHAEIYKSLSDKNTRIECLPLGVDKTYWKPVPSRGKFSGEPSLLTAENCHYIKWPLDLFLLWPFVYPKVKCNPSLHSIYLPTNMHRWFFPLVNRNGCSYGSHITALTFADDDLRNALNSVDFYIGLVIKGDHNRMCLEANACGAKTISYRGNPYSDYWLTEGSQLEIAKELIAILNGEVTPREKSPVPDILDTAKGMKALYESL